jgi:hypothetical protein
VFRLVAFLNASEARIGLSVQPYQGISVFVSFLLALTPRATGVFKFALYFFYSPLQDDLLMSSSAVQQTAWYNGTRCWQC